MKAQKRVLSKKFQALLSLMLCLTLLGVPSVPAQAALEGVSDAYNGALNGVENLFKESKLKSLRDEAVEKYGLRVSPYLLSSFELSNNIFLSPNVHSDGTIWTFTPGVKMTHTGDYGQAGIQYEAPFHYFTKYGDQNEQDQNFLAFGDFYLNEYLELHISNDLRQEGATSGGPELDPVNYLENTFDVNVIYINDRISAMTGYQNYQREFAGDLFGRYDYSEDKFYTEGGYEIRSDLKATVGYNLAYVNYENDPTRYAYYWELPVGLEGVLPVADINYRVKVGPHVRSQENDARNDFWAFIGSVSVSKQLTAKTSLEIGFDRKPYESTFDNVPIFDQKTFYGTVQHYFTDKVRGRFDIFHVNRDWEQIVTVGSRTAKRDDELLGFGFGVDYAARKWLIFNVGYRFERRNSNYPDFDYTDNRLKVGVTIPV